MVSRIYFNKIMYFSLPLIYCLFAIYALKILPFSYQPSTLVITYSIVDVIISIALISIFIKFNFESIKFGEYIESNLIVKLDRYWLFIFLMAVLCLFYAKNSIASLSSGLTREDLVLGGNSSILMMFMAPFFKIITPISIYFGARFRVSFILLTGLIGCLFYSASMAELLYFVFVFISLFTFFNLRNSIVILTPVLVVFLLSFIVARYGQSVRYGENIDLHSFSLLMMEKVFKYRAFSIYLSEKLLCDTTLQYKYLYPFWGYSSEWIISKFYPEMNYFDSIFITKYHYLGGDKMNPYLANVIYPWWSFFVFVFGPIGIIVKAFWGYCILVLFTKLRLYLTTIYIMVLILYIGQFTFPLISLNALITILTLVFIDFLMRFKKIKI